MNTPFLKDKITIVIPSKNEKRNLYDCIYHISKQTGIEGTKVIIADISDDKESLDMIERIKTDFRYSLNIEIIKGGYPAYGRYMGAKKATTPYILFLDADIFLIEKDIIAKTLNTTTHLTTVSFITDKGYNWIYKTFFQVQKLMKLCGNSFAIGGFQLFRTDIYKFAGEYNPNHIFAEDYYISNKIWSPFLNLYKTNGVYTSSRRFKNKGLLYMILLMMKCWINKNNEAFYTKSHGYWD